MLWGLVAALKDSNDALRQKVESLSSGAHASMPVPLCHPGPVYQPAFQHPLLVPMQMAPPVPVPIMPPPATSPPAMPAAVPAAAALLLHPGPPQHNQPPHAGWPAACIARRDSPGSTETTASFLWTPCALLTRTSPEGTPYEQPAEGIPRLKLHPSAVQATFATPLLYWEERSQWMWHKKWCLPRLSITVALSLDTPLGHEPLVAMVRAGGGAPWRRGLPTRLLTRARVAAVGVMRHALARRHGAREPRPHRPMHATADPEVWNRARGDFLVAAAHAHLADERQPPLPPRGLRRRPGIARPAAAARLDQLARLPRRRAKAKPGRAAGLQHERRATGGSLGVQAVEASIRRGLTAAHHRRPCDTAPFIYTAPTRPGSRLVLVGCGSIFKKPL